MTKNTLIFLFVVVITSTNIFAQTVNSSHVVEATGQPNEFLVKTAITGLENVDIARIEYDIDDIHMYTPSPNNSFFTDRKNNQLKFYLMAVPASGIINIEFILTISNGQTLNIPAAIQYSRNEVKDKVALAPLTINIDGSASTLASTTPEVKEETEATEETTTPVESEKEKEEEIVAEVIEETEEEVEEETEEEVEEESSMPVVEETPEEEPTPPVETTYKKPEEKPKPTPTPTNTSSKKQYGVQILALSEYSETRVRNFCKQHGLDYNLTSKENVGGLTKIRYGKSSSATEIQNLKEELINKGLRGVFMVTLP